MRPLIILTFLTACTSTEPMDDEADDLISLLDTRGPHAVGFRSDTITYVVPGQAEPREVRMSIWYPATSTDGEEVAYQDIFSAPDVWEDASPVSGPYPTLVYSHGHQGYAEASGLLMAHFASHGWLVAAPDHTNNTTWDGSNRDTEIYYQRPLDISAVLDHLEALPQSDPLAGANTEETIAIGHSFGGYTTFALGGATYAMDDLRDECASGTGPSSFCSTMTPEKEALFEAGFYDARIIGSIPMAAGDYDLFRDTGYATLQTPVFQMTGELDPATGGSSEPIWKALAGAPHRRLTILGGGHQTFTDFSGILEQFDGLIEPEEGHRILRIYTLAYAQYLLGDTDRIDVLNGTLPVSDRAVLTP